ncbi:MAG: tyrosine-type recombinase/integrase [Peptococcaceae bacterium]|nr:tyrosine-type recombinase/integrase [Peptococcaceae bacterium]
MKIHFKPTGNGCYDNLLRQFAKVARNCNQESKTTRYRYMSSYKTFLQFCAKKYKLQNVKNIQQKHLEAYIEYRRTEGISDKTIKGDLAAIRFWHAQIPGARYELPENDQLSIKLDKTPEVKGENRAWRDREFEKMVALAEKQGRYEIAQAMKIARYAGLRIHECYRMDRATAEMAIRTGELTIKGKGGLVRTFTLSERAKEVLKESIEGKDQGDKLFLKPDQKAHQAMQAAKDFIRRHRDKVQEPGDGRKPLTFHGLRHTFAREDYQGRVKDNATAKEKKIARLATSKKLGHHRDYITKVYTGPG